MSDPFITKFNWGRYFLIGALIGVAVFVFILAISVVAYSFTSYQSTGGLPIVDSPSAQVAIGNPNTGAQLNAGESLLVNATSIGPNAFLSMELWVDGELAGVQAAPSGGVHPFSTFFSWIPQEPGGHSLIAAAIDSVGQKTISAQVIVLVTQEVGGGTMTITGQDVSPAVLPAPVEGGYTPPNHPETSDSVGPAEDWSGSPGNWVNSLTADEKPAAPELVASPGQCEATLSIHDLSKDEEGFVVYRQTPNSPTWMQIATLSSQSQDDWLTYTDSIQSGAITYYVSAFNNQGETDSNLALVNIDPTDCASESGNFTASSLEVTLQMPYLAGGMTYCYQSTDGINWARWPQFGFLTPDKDGFVTGEPVVQMLPNGLAGQPAVQRLDLFLECWGWQEGTLQFLDDFFVEGMDPQNSDSQLVAGEVIQAEVVFNPVDLVGQADFYPLGVETIGGSDFMSAQDQQQLLTSINPELPTPWLFQTTDPISCGWHVPTHAANSAGRALYCFVYPKFDPAQGAVSTQPYLIWTFGLDSKLTCLAGSGDDCATYAELLTRAEQTGGHVGFDITSISNAGTFVWPVTEPKKTMYVVPPLDCTGDSKYAVRLWYMPGTSQYSIAGEEPAVGIDMEGSSTIAGEKPAAEINLDSPYTAGVGEPVATVQEIFYSLPSNWETIPCIPPKINKNVEYEYHQYLDITFQTIDLYDLDDGDVYLDAYQDVEIYGYFRVVAPTMGQEVEPPGGCFLDMCGDDGTYLANTRRNINIADWGGSDPGEQYCTGCAVRKEDGHFDLAKWPVCQSTNKYSCLYEGQNTSYLTNNNTIRVFVKYGDALSLEINLIDYDEDSGDDTICHTQKLTPSRGLSEWANIKNERYEFYGPETSSGFCYVVAVINAVNP